MKILAIGDIVSSCGREYVYNNLGKIRKKYDIDYCIANGENAAECNGITEDIARNLIECGIDVITMGNHTFSNRESAAVLEDNQRVIRPVNFPPESEGQGYFMEDLGNTKVAVINAIGRVGMDAMDCPFRATERILEKISGEADIIIIDFHAETSSEKLAFGNYFDGKVNIIFGTHTHIQTADAMVLPGGTGYISDLGMTGVRDSVLGVKKDIIIKLYYERKRQKFEKAVGEVWFCGCVFDIDEKSGKVNSLNRLYFSENERF